MRSYLAAAFLVVAVPAALLVVALAVAGGGAASSSGSSSGASSSGSSSGASSSGSSSNGEASKPAQQVLADALKAAQAASSFHMSLSSSPNGRQLGIDITVVKGKGATGSFTSNGLTVDLLVVGSAYYMKASAAYWTQVLTAAGVASGTIATISTTFGGKWLKFSPRARQSGALAAITTLAHDKAIFAHMTSNHGPLANKGVTTYNGQSVVDIFDRSKNASLYVATTGTAYPVATVKTGIAARTLTFDSWNKSVTLSAPSGAIDLSLCQGLPISSC